MAASTVLPTGTRPRGPAWPFDGSRGAHDLERGRGGRIAESDKSEPNLAEAIRRRFTPLSGVDLDLPPSEFVDAPPSFDP